MTQKRVNALRGAAFGGEKPLVGVVVVFRSGTGLKICGVGLLNMSVQRHGRYSAAAASCALLQRLWEILEHDFQPEKS